MLILKNNYFGNANQFVLFDLEKEKKCQLYCFPSELIGILEECEIKEYKMISPLQSTPYHSFQKLSTKDFFEKNVEKDLRVWDYK